MLFFFVTNISTFLTISGFVFAIKLKRW